MIVKQQSIYSIDPGTFVYDPENPTKYTEQLSFVISKNLHNLALAGFQFRQAEKMIADVTQTGLADNTTAVSNAGAYLNLLQQHVNTGLLIPTGEEGAGESWLQYLLEDAATGVEGTIADALWNAQTAFIEGENTYLAQLNTQWKAAQKDIEDGKIDGAIDLLLEAGEEAIEKGVIGLLALAGISLTGGWAIVVGAVVSVAAGYGLTKLKEVFIDFLKESNALLEAMQAEDAAMIAAEQTPQNYDRRNEVIQRHERTIYRLLDELDRFRKRAEDTLDDGDTIIIGGGGETGGAGTSGSWEEESCNITDVLKRALLRAKTADENPEYESVLDTRLEDLACEERTVRVGDVEINTKGRYVKH